MTEKAQAPLSTAEIPTFFNLSIIGLFNNNDGLYHHN
jgi:hypothetical protein